VFSSVAAAPPLAQHASPQIRASFLEVYNEQVVDLLAGQRGLSGSLSLRWKPELGFFVGASACLRRERLRAPR
jgi:hypothetical protein